MKFVIFIISFFAAVCGKAQSKVDDNLAFQLFCGVAAQTSKEIKDFKATVDINDTAEIFNKLFTGSKIEQVLAAITLKYFHHNGSLQLSKNRRKRIGEIGRLKDKFSLCFTCTFHQEGTVKKLFNRKTYSGAYSILESFLSEKL